MTMATTGNGLTGLANVGNTCYLNSLIQVLSHTRELNEVTQNPDTANKLNKTIEAALLLEWEKLRSLMWSEDCTIAPWGFVNAVRKVAKNKNREFFTMHQQCDIDEFMQFLLSCFHEGLSREVQMSIKGKTKNKRDKLAEKCYTVMKNMHEKDYSELLDIFFGISVTTITGTDKSLYSAIPEPISVINVPIPPGKEHTLASCISHLCRTEDMTGDDKYYHSEKNEYVDAQLKMSYWSLPKVLIIVLKRFTNSNRKIQTPVQIPLEPINMSPLICGYRKEDYKYELYGVCNHAGTALGGHYTATVNTPKGWHNFNDTSITSLDGVSNIVNPTQAYALFFRKVKK